AKQDCGQERQEESPSPYRRRAGISSTEKITRADSSWRERLALSSSGFGCTAGHAIASVVGRRRRFLYQSHRTAATARAHHFHWAHSQGCQAVSCSAAHRFAPL